MKLLIDTHLLIWASSTSFRLSTEAKSLMGDPENELFFSSASLWEVAIKQSQGRSDFPADARQLRRSLSDNAYTELPISGDHAVAVADLPWLHKDPFDRLLVAQATVEGILLLTSDRQVADYSGPIRLV
ncbi:type II toxin-antitoxin system VapC family toxin [Asticcacaulis taihuensis]|jgi:PIN domain nuclease of toxin-antitoxin system|uniref:type II toxin-antitoxin system VapC family toxin n=1 Tax=Asticcacaulis taihuensis TaxID=260084 RepID=UPI0026F2B3BE|nr:type II toxin-antitoxin system VapC family toxin [Asticcacaulis taihuensis]